MRAAFAAQSAFAILRFGQGKGVPEISELLFKEWLTTRYPTCRDWDRRRQGWL